MRCVGPTERLDGKQIQSGSRIQAGGRTVEVACSGANTARRGRHPRLVARPFNSTMTQGLYRTFQAKVAAILQIILLH